MARQDDKRDALQMLAADHRKVEELFEKFESARGGAARGKIVRQICEELTIHTMIEEQVFYPAVRDAVTADVAEHEAARARILSSGAAASASRAVTDSYQRLFVVGRRSWLEVMNAALETTQAELAADDAEVAAMASAARLSLLTCRWRPEIE